MSRISSASPLDIIYFRHLPLLNIQHLHHHHQQQHCTFWSHHYIDWKKRLKETTIINCLLHHSKSSSTIFDYTSDFPSILHDHTARYNRLIQHGLFRESVTRNIFKCHQYSSLFVFCYHQILELYCIVKNERNLKQ